MKVLVTGASGFIGMRLCHRLADSGYEVVALYRNRSRLKELHRVNITPVHCDIESLECLREAIKGCDYCFHLAALAKHWHPDSSKFERVHVEGTRNVLTAALESRIRRMVFTSTASVYGPADPSNPVNEQTHFAQRLDSEYERTKQACEPVISEFQSQGLDVVSVYPSRVYGPGVLNSSNVLTDIFRRFLDGTWRFVPGNGDAIGNYVFVDDVVAAHLLAMFKSEKNERYLIGGKNLSFNQVVEQLRSSTGNSHRMYHVPKSVLLIFANLQLIKARMLGRPPTITPAFVSKYLKNWCIDCSKAESELDYSPMTFKDGLESTLDWIRTNQIKETMPNLQPGD